VIAHGLSSPWPGFNSQPWRSISRDFSLADRTLPIRPEPAWQKIAQSPLKDHHTTCGQRGGRPKFNHGQTMADKKRDSGIAGKSTGLATVASLVQILVVVAPLNRMG